jgi:hypothetical protein
MFATITHSTVAPSPTRFQVNIYIGRQLKKIVRNGGDYSQCVRYCDFEGLDIKESAYA